MYILVHLCHLTCRQNTAVLPAAFVLCMFQLDVSQLQLARGMISNASCAYNALLLNSDCIVLGVKQLGIHSNIVLGQQALSFPPNAA